MKKKLGMILKDKLEHLIEDESLDNDYHFLKTLSDVWGGHKNLGYDSDFSDIDAVFFLYYPFNKNLAQKLKTKEKEIPFINKPSGVLKTSSKIFEYETFKDVSPATKLLKNVSYDELYNFSNQFDSIVIKPVIGTGGKGIYFLDKPYEEKNMLDIQNLSETNRGEYLIQEYLENEGDRRILCYNGKIMGGFDRRGENTRIHNLSLGGKITGFNPDKKDIDLANYVSNKLKDYGIFFTGIDIINNKLIEVNTAMPGGAYVMKLGGLLNSEKKIKNFFKTETQNIIKSYK